MGNTSRTEIAFHDALQRIVSQCDPLERITVSLEDAVGLCPIADLSARTDSPPFRTSAMDGYGLRSQDAIGASGDHPVRLTVIGSIAAGKASASSVGPGECIRIMTGGRCPVEIDAVAPLETVEESGTTVTLTAPLRSGEHIRPAAEDFATGTRLIAAGTVLDPAAVGLLASAGHSSVNVHPRPRVALLTVGDELIAPGSTRSEATIWDSNSVMVGALIGTFGGVLAGHIRVVDNTTSVRGAIVSAIEQNRADLIVTVGGASRGDHDVVAEVAQLLDHATPFDVRMKPGRPLLIAKHLGLPIVGLPGNPAAAFVSAWQFVRPAIRRLAGDRNLYLPELTARSLIDLPASGARHVFHRAALRFDDGGALVALAGSQSSASHFTLARTNAFLVQPEETGPIATGDLVPVQLLADIGGAAGLTGRL